MDEMIKEKCFVIMPISDPEGYEEGHFLKIYEQLFKPAIEAAGYESHRVDEDKSVGMIHAKILTALVEAPMALCDLSTRNPNVLFELGMRQAFDKPAVLVQEIGTKRIFDINGIDAIDYRKNRLYDEIIEDQKKITNALLETKKDGKFNSLIKLLKIAKADFNKDNLSKEDTTEMMLRGIISEISGINNRLANLTDSERGRSAILNTKIVRGTNCYKDSDEFQLFNTAKFLRNSLYNETLDEANRKKLIREAANLLSNYFSMNSMDVSEMGDYKGELRELISDLERYVQTYLIDPPTIKKGRNT